jgi:xylan 1,4-beta-xylosidase
VTEAAVHDALPTAYFGGPATTGTDLPDGNAALFLDAFLAHVKGGTNYHSGATGTRVDFLSFHTKGRIYTTTLRRQKQLPTIDLFLENVRVAAAIIRKHGYASLEICLSEADPDSWAAGGRYDNFNLNFRNTEYFASYVACSYERLYALAEELGMDLRPLAWTFAFDWERLFEGMRTFTTRGVDKAVFNLFKLYARLGTKRVEAHVEGAVQDPDGTYAGVWSFWADTPGSGNKKTLQVCVVRHHDDWDIDRDALVRLRIQGLPMEGKVEVRRFRIDQAHSNPYAEWRRQGQPDYPAPQVYDAIKQRDGLEEMPLLHGETAAGTLTLDTLLSSHAVELLEIRPVSTSLE